MNLLKLASIRIGARAKRRIILPRPGHGFDHVPTDEELQAIFRRADQEIADAIRSIPCHYADLSITATTVAPGTGAVINPISSSSPPLYGETVTAGMPIYRKASDSKLYKAKNEPAVAEVYTVAGIALVGGAINQIAVYQTGGQITIGATVALTVEYYLSNNFGGICPIADVASAKRKWRIGYADTVSTITFDMRDQGTMP